MKKFVHFPKLRPTKINIEINYSHPIKGNNKLESHLNRKRLN